MAKKLNNLDEINLDEQLKDFEKKAKDFYDTAKSVRKNISNYMREGYNVREKMLKYGGIFHNAKK